MHERRSGPLFAIAAALTCTTIGVFPPFLLGSLAALVRRDLSFGAAGLGIAIGCYYGASAVAAVLGGRLAERIGARRALTVGVALAAAAMGFLAVATTTWAELLPVMAVAGVANGIIQPSANLALARSVPPHRLGFAMGAKQSAIPTATLVAGLAVPAVGLTIGWRWAFGAATLIAAVLVVILAPRRPDTVEPSPRREARPTVRVDPARRSALVRISVSAGCGAVAANSLGAFFVESVVASGQRLAVAGLLLSWCSVGGLMSRFLGGWYADLHPGDPLRSAGRMMVLGTVGILGLAYLHGTVWLVVASLVAFGAGWGWPGLLQLGVVRDHMDAPGAASGIAHAGALLGGLVGPVAFGWMVSVRGYELAWTVTSSVALAGGCLLLWERRRAASLLAVPRLPTTQE